MEPLVVDDLLPEVFYRFALLEDSPFTTMPLVCARPSAFQCTIQVKGMCMQDHENGHGSEGDSHEWDDTNEVPGLAPQVRSVSLVRL